MADTSYLHNLKFDQKLKNSFVAKYILNQRLVLLVTLTIIGIGFYSFFNLPKTLNPEIKIPIVIVSTVLPGAGPKDVESLVTIPIEDGVSSVARVKTVTSSSQDSVSVVQLEFESGVDPDKARADVKSAVDSVTTLPKDAKTPNVVKLDFSNAPVWTFTLSTSQDSGSLMRYAKTLRQKIVDLPSVDKVDISGLEEQEMQIVIRPASIATYNLNPQQLSQIIATAIKAFPAGNITTNTSTFAISLDQAANSLEDIRNLQISINGNVVPLSQIADVYEKPKPDQNPGFIASKRNKPSSAVTFNVFKTNSVNTDKAYQDTKKLLDDEPGIKNHQFTVYSVQNAAKKISDQFGDLQRDFAITIALVFIVLFIFLGVRQALIASIAIPLTFFISFTIMNLTGIALSFISLFSLLLALGLLVDDTIVVVSAMTAYHRTGKFTPAQTGLLVWRDFLVAISTTTVTTVWAFLPLLLSTGIIGEFIKPIPIVVSSTLMASLFVAMFITLPAVIFFLKPNMPRRVVILLQIVLFIAVLGTINFLIPKTNLFLLEFLTVLVFLFIAWQVKDILWETIRNKFLSRKQHANSNRQYLNDGLIHFTIISDRYHRFIEGILQSKSKRRTTIFIAIVFSLFSYLLLPLGFVHNEFFPKADQDFVFMSLELPAGTNVSQAAKQATSIANTIRTFPDIDFVTAEVGQAFSSSGGGAGGAGTNNILFTLILQDKNKRKLTSSDIGQKLRDTFGTYPAGKVAVTESTGGPPAGSDLQIKLFGPDLSTLNNYADKIQNYLHTQAGVVNIDKTIKPGTSKLVFVPDNAKLAGAHLTQDQIGLWLRLFASGLSVDSVKFGDATVKEDITIRMNATTQKPETLGSIVIPGQANSRNTGANPATTLASLGILKLESNPTLITRENGKRTISVTASVSQGFSVSTLNKQLENYANSLNLPSGYSWATGGVNDENQKSVQSILAAMLLSFLLIIITMVIQFGSFRRALIVMLVIPLSISGVFIIFALTNTPLSFPALIGVLALFGIVVKNSILVVDKIVQNQKAGLPFITAIADAASSRLEAIALTSVATIIGLTPITLSDPIWRGLGGAIIAGLFFSGTIMLFFIPVVYYSWFANDERIIKL